MGSAVAYECGFSNEEFRVIDGLCYSFCRFNTVVGSSEVIARESIV